jgi:quinol monooxygenase YgiN
MSASVVVAFACAVVAAAGTGVLVGRCIRMPRLDLIAWACALAALAVALVAVALGADRGYGSATFRAVQFSSQLIAPLWLAWGLTELVAKSVPVRFASKLVTMALTVVTGVVLVTDPLSSARFSKAWPLASKHYQIIPRSLLSLVAVVTLIVVVAALATSLLRLRADPAWRRPAVAVTAASIAAVLILGLRLSLPANGAYLALIVACVALLWFAGVWAARIDLVDLHEEIPPARTDRGSHAQSAAFGGPAEDEAFSAGYPPAAENGSSERYDHDDWYRPVGGIRANGGFPPGQGQPPGAAYPAAGEYEPAAAYPPSGAYPPGAGYPPNAENAMNGAAGAGGLSGADRTGIWQPRTLGGPVRAAVPDPIVTGAAAAAAAAATGPEPAVDGADPEATQRLYGLIAIYTLAEGTTADFDALAEQVVAEVRANEPDALVYAVHSVPNAEMQRIFYEVYRDRMAYEDHKRQPHIQRFEADCGPYVLATNVIELGMQQAKLSALPGLSQLFGSSPGA